MSTNINKQKWPEPRPIKEAPKDGSTILGWTEDVALRMEGWESVSWDKSLKCWIDYAGYVCHPTHFLPLPPKPEVVR